LSEMEAFFRLNDALFGKDPREDRGKLVRINDAQNALIATGFNSLGAEALEIRQP
jgi:hypothetical protein